MDWEGYSPALTSAHLDLTLSKAARRCINNTYTYVQYVLHEKYTNADRHALEPKNKHMSSYMSSVYVYADKMYVKYKQNPDAAGPSCPL